MQIPLLPCGWVAQSGLNHATEFKSNSHTIMLIRPLVKRVLRITAIPLAVYLLLVILVYFWQRSLLFFPTHTIPSSPLKPWSDGTRTIGF